MDKEELGRSKYKHALPFSMRIGGDIQFKASAFGLPLIFTNPTIRDTTSVLQYDSYIPQNQRYGETIIKKQQGKGRTKPIKSWRKRYQKHIQ